MYRKASERLDETYAAQHRFAVMFRRRFQAAYHHDRRDHLEKKDEILDLGGPRSVEKHYRVKVAAELGITEDLFRKVLVGQVPLQLWHLLRWFDRYDFRDWVPIEERQQAVLLPETDDVLPLDESAVQAPLLYTGLLAEAYGIGTPAHRQRVKEATAALEAKKKRRRRASGGAV